MGVSKDPDGLSDINCEITGIPGSVLEKLGLQFVGFVN